MASHPLIHQQLARLRTELPAEVVDELADGLIETWEHYLTSGVDPTKAARQAIADFGTPEETITAFATQAPGRRVALLLLGTGPVVGAIWGASLVTTRAWTWPIPMAVVAGFGILLVAVVVALIISVISRNSYRRTRIGLAAALGTVIFDGTILTTVLVASPVLAWPIAAAVPVSLTRIALTLRSLRRARGLDSG